MSIAGVRAAAGSRWRRARAGMRGCAIALTYHRVADLDSDPQLLAVSVESFRQQIAVLARDYETLTAGELAEAMHNGGRLPRRAVVVTIDDGYADTMTAAEPILAEHGLRATAFLASSPLESEALYWWDRLEDLVFAPGEVPAHIELVIGNDRFHAELSDSLVWDEDDVLGHVSWTVLQPPPTDRHRLFRALNDWLRGLRPEEREDALDQLAGQIVGRDRAPARDHALLRAHDLPALDDRDTIEIGAHTAEHALLSGLTAEEQRDQIVGGKTRLEALLGRRVPVMSYPHGGPDDFDATAKSIARDAGFTCAFSTRFGTILPWTDRYAIPRCHTENISGAAFSALLKGWFDAAL